MSYKDDANKLSTLETFDPNVFKGDDKVSQQQCNFILALSIAYNDLRDATFALIMLNDVEIDNDKNISPQIGLLNGLNVTAIRVRTGFIRELIVLVKENVEVNNEPSFKSLIKKLSVEEKKSWSAIQTVAYEKKPDDPLSKALIIIRNKVAFHYDASQIGNSYKSAFLQPSEYGKPLLSRGPTMCERRFYYADAITQKYIKDKSTQQIVADYFDGKGKLLEDVNQALYALITKFINSRSPWQKN